MAPPRKRPGTAQDSRNGAQLVVVARPDSANREVPNPPDGLLRASVEKWDKYWRDEVSQVATDVDLPLVERWITDIDEWTRAMAAMRKERLVAGSQGQPRVNPLSSWIQSRETAIKDAEDRLGMSPKSRAALGIAYGQAQLTAAELNRMTMEGAEDLVPIDDEGELLELDAVE